MAHIDEAGEHDRLERLYAELSDDQLFDLLNQVDDLEEAARQILQAEALRRGLDEPGRGAPAEETPPSENDLEEIWQVKDDAEGPSIIDILKSAGIPAILGTRRVELVGGEFEEQTVVKVLPMSSHHALALLDMYFPREPDPEEEKVSVVLCPQCHSPEIVFQSLEAAPGQEAKKKFNWSCDACGHQWKDDGLEQTA